MVTDGNGTQTILCMPQLPGFQEKIIAERTGHRSLAGLCAYERTTDDQDKAADYVHMKGLLMIKIRLHVMRQRCYFHVKY